ncbi:hypothetical protein [Pseudomonas koreensis]|uniref:hypothetical protein n=1 Tax=Pseudomonas koreensis TaxID=198620 RepID=UPI002076E05E|nr:hypothetical protein [Pseudomonas koreensis]MCM8742347.1 hypothetical protein [Pseudomonas koreensis]
MQINDSILTCAGGKMLYIARKTYLPLVFIVPLASMTGCMGPEFRTLQVLSLPEGATIRQDSGGLPPKVSHLEARYRSSELKKRMENGCFLISGYTATWPSGAKASTGVIRWCNTQYPGMTVYIDRPKDAPNFALDNKPNEEREARQKIEYEQYQKQQLEEARIARSNPPVEHSGEDDDIGMAGALAIIANSYAVSQSSAKRSTNNRVAPVQIPSMQQQSQILNSHQALAANQGYQGNQSNMNKDSGGNFYDYDVSHPQCVTYGRHPSLRDYAQYTNTCPYDVNVTYCAVSKSGKDNCASKIFGSFELRSGETNIAEGTDASVKYVVCKLPYRAIGSEVTVSGGRISAPCQKNK